MINNQLINPNSIVVIGGSENIAKPGGKVLKNLLDGNFKGDVYVTNPKSDTIQGLKSYSSPNDLPNVDLAIIAIAAKYVVDIVKVLTEQKNTKAFIILSAGFSEENPEGGLIEQEIVELINKVDGSLIGPNCIGVLNNNYSGIFTTPIPRLDPKGCDFISGSGATAVFIIEAGVQKGLTFNSVFSVGNSAQIGVEEVMKHLDETFDPETSSRVKMLYIEDISKPKMLLKHTSSLIKKGCKIAAVKSGSSEAGSRAASSHTGALASPDVSVDALFRKAGIVRCMGREDLTTMACVFLHEKPKGKNFAIITHAGGPAVMLTDALSNGGLDVPHIEGEAADRLLTKLYPGSSVSNPIDFLATGTAQQLGDIIDACDKDFDNIDAIAVVFGSPGLFNVSDAYKVLHEKMKTCSKPIFPILPSVINAKNEIEEFLNYGRINFPDEVVFGDAMVRYMATPEPIEEEENSFKIDANKAKTLIDACENGYISPEKVSAFLDLAGISRAHEAVVDSVDAAVEKAKTLGFPLVMKVVGPVHKSDVGGVTLNVNDIETVKAEFERMIVIKDTTAILMQQMLSGTELYAGANKDEKFGHTILAGMGGIFIEVLKDVQSAIVPVGKNEAEYMIKNLRSYALIKGVRGQEGINQDEFIKVITRLSLLLEAVPEIIELDLNPLLGNLKQVVAVDARICIEK